MVFRATTGTQLFVKYGKAKQHRVQIWHKYGKYRVFI